VPCTCTQPNFVYFGDLTSWIVHFLSAYTAGYGIQLFVPKFRWWVPRTPLLPWFCSRRQPRRRQRIRPTLDRPSFVGCIGKAGWTGEERWMKTMMNVSKSLNSRWYESAAEQGTVKPAASGRSKCGKCNNNNREFIELFRRLKALYNLLKEKHATR